MRLVKLKEKLQKTLKTMVSILRSSVLTNVSRLVIIFSHVALNVF